jgi:uncharacterized protein (DUF2267 family)
MEYKDVLHLVERGAGVGRAQAARATEATLRTLAERITRSQALELAAKLPSELTGWIDPAPEAEPFDVGEFVRRVAQREGVDEQSALQHARAVFAALWQAVGPGEMTDIEAELSMDYDRLLPQWPASEEAHAQSFYRRVAQREGLSLDDAWRATEAVLETLAERITRGEVEDLMERLPLELQVPLKRGLEHSGGKAIKMSLDEFIAEVASRAGVDRDLARDYVRGVIAVLRETVGENEFAEMSAQLPREYLAELVPSR